MKQVVRLAAFSKTDYNYLLTVIENKSDIPDSFEVWSEVHKAEKKELYEKGCRVREIKIDVDELIEYCELRNLKLNVKAIQQYVLNF
ncbi:MAG TPA: hypothetical protein PLZ52_06975 [Bacteroidales bacterium]|nr:hypothetical protein [Bacteroidales bacterium]HOE04941.1 hypothetical protein [Bacteroidales bacterium]HQL71163.1 hypothetical protein [Bacteroidales bacterium]